MDVAVFHPGTQHSWQTTLALQELDRLAWFATSLFYQPDRWPYRAERWLPAPLARRAHAEFRRLAHPGIDPAKVRTSGLIEWAERIATRAGRPGLARRLDAWGNRRFSERLAADIDGPAPFALWGYSGSSATAFAHGRNAGRTLILDRTIGDFRAFNAAMDDVHERYPEWFVPTERAAPQSLIDNDELEYDLADRIVVGSEFAAGTVRTWGGKAAAAKVEVLPYCFDEALFAAQPAPMPVSRSEPIRFLFIGQVNPRKGAHHLLEAIMRLPPELASLTIVGDLRVPRPVFARYAERVTYVPTVARADIPAIMAAHHVLVFPSYFEGSALSLLEGLASGLALIQTPSSGNGVTAETGIMLDHPDTEALLAAMEALATDRDRLDAMRAAAPARAQDFTFARYRDGIARTLAGLGL